MATPKQITTAVAYRQLVDQGDLWTAPSGAVFRVRELNLFDRVVLGQMPTHLQSVVSRLIDEVEALRDTTEEQDATEEFVSLLGDGAGKLSVSIGNAYELAAYSCVLGIIEPQVVLTMAEVTDPETQLCVTQLAEDDRMAFFARTMTRDAQEADVAATFPDRSARTRRRA
jgi:hypothetical protein